MKKLVFSAALVFASIGAFAQVAPSEKYDPIKVCVIEDDILKEIIAYYDKNTGTTYVDRDGELLPFDDAYTLEDEGYSASKTWYINNEEVEALGKTYVKYGLPRVLGVLEIEKVGVYDKVGIYAEVGATGTPEVIYIPVRPGCEFQPYQVMIEEIKIQESKKMQMPPKK